MSMLEIPLEKEGTTVRWLVKVPSEIYKATYKMSKSIAFGTLNKVKNI